MTEQEGTTEMARYIVMPLDGDTDTPIYAYVPNSTNLNAAVAWIVGVGNPYWAFDNQASISLEVVSADEIGADFSGAPLATDDEETNETNLLAMYTSPPLVGAVTGSKVWDVANPPD